MSAKSARPQPRPPRWAEALLRFFLSARDLDTVSVDLLEEYREVVLPEKGRLGAQLWYLRQTFCFMGSVKTGLALGIVFSGWNLIFTYLSPSAEDTVTAIAGFYGPMFAVWGAVGFAAFRQTNKFVKAGESGHHRRGRNHHYISLKKLQTVC